MGNDLTYCTISLPLFCSLFYVNRMISGKLIGIWPRRHPRWRKPKKWLLIYNFLHIEANMLNKISQKYLPIPFLVYTVVSRSNAHPRLNAHPPTLFKSQVFFLLISNVSQAPTPLKIMNANFGAHGRLSERLRYKLKLRGRTGNE